MGYSALLKALVDEEVQGVLLCDSSFCVFVCFSHPAVSPTEASAKKEPKYLRNSLDQAICMAICLSLIWFCIMIWRSNYTQTHTKIKK